MKCHSDTGKCRHNPKCEHACHLRVQYAQPPAVDVGAKCREAYETRFHKVKATIGYDDWRAAYEAGRRAESSTGFAAGWASCTQAWAEHMRGMAQALAKQPSP